MYKKVRAEKEFIPWSFDRVMAEARKIGPNILNIVTKLFDETKVKEQALNATVPIVELKHKYSNEEMEKAARYVIKNYALPRYEHLVDALKYYKGKHGKKEIKSSHTRGADYYKKGNKL